jgi:hypothetical protein
MPVTIPQSEIILRSYFETGDQPTQDQFAELIGTMFYLAAQAAAIASSAGSDAAAALARTPLAVCSAKYPGSGAGYTIEEGNNVSAVAFQNFGNPTTRHVRFSFTVPIVDADYVVSLTPLDPAIGPPQVQLVEKTITEVGFRFNVGGAVSSAIMDRLMLVVHKAFP